MTIHRSNDGYILVAVLSVMVLLTGFLAAGSVVIRSELHSAAVDDGGLAMDGLTRGGLELTAYQLFERKLPFRLVDGRPIRFAGGIVAAKIEDEAGKVDLNGADTKLLSGVFSSAGLDAETVSTLVTRIVSMRGADRANARTEAAVDPLLTGVTGGDPALSDQPLETQPVSRASRRLRGLQSVDQIREFGVLSRAEFKRLAPRLTVYNPDGRINVLSASRDVLGAIPGLTKPALEAVLLRRDDAPKATTDALLAFIGEAAVYTKIVAGPAFAVRIDATIGSGRRKTIETVIAASKSPNEPYLILDWRDGS